MRLYSLRHKATGTFMPARMSRSSTRGYSSWSPGLPNDGMPSDRSPRLFPSLRAATNARTLWAAGVWEHQYYSHGEYYGLKPMKPPAPRHKDDLEIVEFDLVEVKPC